MKKFATFLVVLTLLLGIVFSTPATVYASSITLLSEITGSGNYELTANITVSAEFEILPGWNVTLDLNGFTIDGALAGRPIKNSGTLDIIDSVGTGTIEGTPNMAFGCVANYGTLTIHSGNFTYRGTNGSCVRNFAGATFTVNGGTFSGDRVFANLRGATTVINGGTFTQTGAMNYYTIQNEGSLTFNSGSVVGANGGLAHVDGNLTINGGVFSANGFYALYIVTESASGVPAGVVNNGTFTSSGLYGLYMNITNPGPGKCVELKGGDFSGTISGAKIFTGGNPLNEPVITGGTYPNSTVTPYMPVDYDYNTGTGAVTPPVYTVVVNFQTVTNPAAANISSEIDSDLSSLSDVYAGGTALTSGLDYNTTGGVGSTVITLAPSYLLTLPNGSYTVEAEMLNGIRVPLPLVVQVPTVPTVPLSFTAAPGNAEVQLNWAAPASDGGSAITGYEIYVDGSLVTTTSGTVYTYTATGLTNGTVYNFEARAVNAVGSGSAATLSIAPMASPPTIAPAAPGTANSVPSGGGNTVIGIAGTNLPSSGILVAAFEENTHSGIAAAIGSANGTSAAATLSFPANYNTTNDKVYTVMVSFDGGSNWFTQGTMVTVQKAYGILAAPAIVTNNTQQESFKIDADYVTAFASGTGSTVWVNGVQLTAGTHYSHAPGSVEITLLPAYLQTLANGSYPVDVQFANGGVATTVLVVAVPGPAPSPTPAAPAGGGAPQTGDASTPALWVSLASISLLGMAMMVWRKKKSAQQARHKNWQIRPPVK